MLRKLLASLPVTIVAMLLLAACGSSDSNIGETGAAAAAPADATLVALKDSMTFEPSTLTVKAGEDVTFNLKNEGAIKHNFEIEEFDIDKDVDAGQSEVVTFTAPTEPGEYAFVCNIPGHEQAGMTGTLVVE